MNDTIPPKQPEDSRTAPADPKKVGRWTDYLDGLNWGPGNRDNSGFLAFVRAGSLGIDTGFAVNEVTHRIKDSGGTYNPSKIQSQLKRAYGHVGNAANIYNAIMKVPKTEYSPEKLAKVASAMPDVDEAWLAAKSPIDPATVSSAQFLESLYNPGEKIVVFTVFESQGQELFEVRAAKKQVLPKWGINGVWFLSNPVDSQSHPNPRQDGKPSRRSEESVTSWRYLVLESDIAPADLWLRALVQVPLRIAAIYTSGGKSIHALVRLDAPSKTEWDRQRDKIKPIMVTLGADPAAMTAVRLTRLPGTSRGRDDRPQQLLFLNPAPTGKPIAEKPK